MKAFTLKSERGLVPVLISPIEVSQAGKNEFTDAKAIWDTGATRSAISKEVAKKLKLKSTGRTQVVTATGEKETKTYTVDIKLPEVAIIKSIQVTEVKKFAGDCEALIGMDIITLGDFSITNLDNTTCMSFRIPSSHEIDYVKSAELGLVEVVKPNGQ